MNYSEMTRVARNLVGVRVGDALVVRNGEVFRGAERVSDQRTTRVASDGEYVVAAISGRAPGDVGYYA